MATKMLEKLPLPRDAVSATQCGFQHLKDFFDSLLMQVHVHMITRVSFPFGSIFFNILIFVLLKAHVCGRELVRRVMDGSDLRS